MGTNACAARFVRGAMNERTLTRPFGAPSSEGKGILTSKR